MLRVFEDAGFEVTRALEGGTTEVGFAIAADRELPGRSVDERDHVAVDRLARSRSSCRATVAIIGASARRGSIGGELFRNILGRTSRGSSTRSTRRHAGRGRARPTRRSRTIPDDDRPRHVLPPRRGVLDEAEEALAQGHAALCVISAGFAEIGVEGEHLQEQLLALVRTHGAAAARPELPRHRRRRAGSQRDVRPAHVPLREDRLLLAERGARGRAARARRAARGLGVSAFVSVGNKADVSSNDLLEWWEDDATTDLILLYLESFGNPRKFARIARRVARAKPILAMKSGRSTAGQRAASSHTAALAGSETADDGALPPGRRDPGRDVRGAARRRRPALRPAAPAGTARGGGDKRRRPRR